MSMIVISVGTSLLNNNRSDRRIEGLSTLMEAFEDNQVSTEAARELSFNFDENGALALEPDWAVDEARGVDDFSESFFEHYLDEDVLGENIRNRRAGKRDRLPAEISSLYLYYYDAEGRLRKAFQKRLKNEDPAEKDTIILLTTDTPDAVLCAKMLKVMIERLAVFNRICEFSPEAPVAVIENLDVYEPEKWTNDDFRKDSEKSDDSKGLTKLYEYFRLGFRKDDPDKVLIRTGGYKEFSADLKLMAIQFNFKSLYLFEKSVKFIETHVKGGWPGKGGDLGTIIKRTRCKN